MEVLVFKTTVENRQQADEIQPLLEAVAAIQEWNFDLDDCDNILRVVSRDMSPGYIESLLQTAGFNCSQLE